MANGDEETREVYRKLQDIVVRLTELAADITATATHAEAQDGKIKDLEEELYRPGSDSVRTELRLLAQRLDTIGAEVSSIEKNQTANKRMVNKTLLGLAVTAILFVLSTIWALSIQLGAGGP